MKSLTGRKIIVTRTEADSEPLAAALRDAGAEAVVFPCITIEYLHDDVTLARLDATLPTADWVVFTSKRGVESLAKAERRPTPRSRLAVVGKATGSAARAAFGRCDLEATHNTGCSLGTDLTRLLKDESTESATVLLVAAAHGRRDVEDALADSGHRVERIDVYHAISAPVDGPPAVLTAMGVDTVILASPSAVRGLLNRAEVDPGVRIVTIGPTTSEAACSAGLNVAAEAAHPSTEGLLEVV